MLCFDSLEEEEEESEEAEEAHPSIEDDEENHRNDSPNRSASFIEYHDAETMVSMVRSERRFKSTLVVLSV